MRNAGYHCWRHDLSEQGWLDWTHARQVVRIQRTAEDPSTGQRTVGNRYYVTSKAPVSLGPKSALKISRGHWRCENNTHWTSDAELMEDRRTGAWSRHPDGVLIVSALRMMALAIDVGGPEDEPHGLQPRNAELGAGGRALFAEAVREHPSD